MEAKCTSCSRVKRSNEKKRRRATKRDRIKKKQSPGESDEAVKKEEKEKERITPTGRMVICFRNTVTPIDWIDDECALFPVIKLIARLTLWI
jgi:hypothetical protein